LKYYSQSLLGPLGVFKKLLPSKNTLLVGGFNPLEKY